MSTKLSLLLNKMTRSITTKNVIYNRIHRCTPDDITPLGIEQLRPYIINYLCSMSGSQVKTRELKCNNLSKSCEECWNEPVKTYVDTRGNISSKKHGQFYSQSRKGLDREWKI